MLNFFPSLCRCTRLHVSPCAFLFRLSHDITFLEEIKRERKRETNKVNKIQNGFQTAEQYVPLKFKLNALFTETEKINRDQKLDNSLACHIYHALFHAIPNHQLSPLIHILVFKYTVSNVHQSKEVSMLVSHVLFQTRIKLFNFKTFESFTILSIEKFQSV